MEISVLSAGVTIDYEWKPQAPHQGLTLHTDCLSSFNEVVSLAVERTGECADSFVLVVSGIPVNGRDNHGRTLYCTLCLSKLTEQQVHAIARCYLLRRKFFEEGVAAGIDGKSADGAVCFNQLRRFLESVADTAPLSDRLLARGSYRARVADAPHWAEDIAKLLQTSVFSKSCGVKMILSDIPGTRTNEADILLTVDAVPDAPEAPPIPQTSARRQDSLIGLSVLLGSALVIGVTVCALFGRRR